MATDAQTLINLVAANQYPKLSERDLLLCLAGYYGGNAGLTAQQAVTLAAQEGYHKLSDRHLYECLLAEIS
jgi:hypothetical protein